ncbi:MAG TPA: hypothetical protein ENO28_17345 [Bacteroidetes bacterium]|nr:hypothetical protein [Bacteroidota bacterium]
MNTYGIADKIIALAKSDLQLRDDLIKAGNLSDGYDKAMEELHNRNANLLNEIIDAIGYPTIEKVGEEATEAAWLVIQHSISQPSFMKKCRELLQIAVSENKANPIQLAYLTDRIAVFEEKPQLYGTQFDWDEAGKLIPNSYDDLAKVNQRRIAIGLNTLEDQTEMIRSRAKNEKQSPPQDLLKRQQELDNWKIRVGWII